MCPHPVTVFCKEQLCGRMTQHEKNIFSVIKIMLKARPSAVLTFCIVAFNVKNTLANYEKKKTLTTFSSLCTNTVI